MKFRVDRIHLFDVRDKPYYVYKVLSPWGAYIGNTYTDKLAAFQWIKDNVERGAWKKVEA